MQPSSIIAIQNGWIFALWLLLTFSKNEKYGSVELKKNEKNELKTDSMRFIKVEKEKKVCEKIELIIKVDFNVDCSTFFLENSILNV